ncbi:MAG: sporulation protein YunB [Ruminococcus sp.]|nr:sporulation protein YunB [Ruminococcus sp.]
MLCHNRKKKRFSKIKKFFFISVVLLTAVIVFCESQLSEFKSEYIRIQAEIISVNSVCDAVNESIKNIGYDYSDIAEVKYSQEGNVQAITTDSFKINELKAEIMKAVQRKIAKIYDIEIDVPIGSFTNLTILSNFGPSITVSFNLTGSFSSEIVSTFASAGINQTIHHIRLILTSEIMTTSLDYSGKMTFSTDFEIAQSIIVGYAPQNYGSLYRSY